jgi:hypothetical protein
MQFCANSVSRKLCMDAATVVEVIIFVLVPVETLFQKSLVADICFSNVWLN